MTTKKETRALKRDARMERRYGNPLMRKIADNDHSVSMYYYHWRSLRREQNWDWIMSGIFMGLGLVEVIILIFSRNDIGFGPITCIFWSMYFILSSRITDLEADRTLDKMVTWASQEAKEKALKDYCKKDEK